MSNLTPFNNNPNMMYANQVYSQYKQPSMNQPLTQEEQTELSRNGGAFNTRLTREEMLRSMCTHKNANGWVLVANGDGTFTCPICQETFTETSLDTDHVKEIAGEFTNIMQLIKTYYVDIPVDTARELFPMMALAKRLPEYAQTALANFAQYERGNLVNNGSNPYGFAAFNTLLGGQGMYGGAGYGMGYGAPGYPNQQPIMPQQMMQGQYQQPMNMGYAPQPMAPQYSPVPQGQPGFMPNNEFGGYGMQGAPMNQGYQPMMQGQQMMPQQMMQGQYQQPNMQQGQTMTANGAMPQPQQQMQPVPQAAPAQGQQAPTNVDVSSFSV